MDNTTIRWVTIYVRIRNYNRSIFFYEQGDYRCWITQLDRYKSQYGLQLHAYALMPDHASLLLTCTDKNQLVTSLGRLELDYASHFNFYHRREHKVLKLDFSLLPVVADQYLLMYYRHIELAPVRAGIVKHPADYPWTSHGINAMGEDTGLLIPHSAYLDLGADAQSRRRSYRMIFDEEQVGLETDHIAMA